MSQPAPGLDIGRSLVEPTLRAWGSDDQRARHLPGIETRTVQWCQPFSEPGADSDLAGLATRAVLHDGTWHVTGQKVWSTLAHLADWASCSPGPTCTLPVSAVTGAVAVRRRSSSRPPSGRPAPW